MGRHEFFGSVRFTAEAELPSDELTDYVLRVEGRASGGLGEDRQFVVETEGIGLIEAYVVQASLLESAGIGLGEACEAHSDHLEGVYGALFDENDDLREGIVIAEPWDVLLHIGWLEVDPGFAESGVAGMLVESAVRHFCPRGLVTAYSSVLDLATGQWRALGFRRIAGSEVVYRDNTASDPYGHPIRE